MLQIVCLLDPARAIYIPSNRTRIVRITSPQETHMYIGIGTLLLIIILIIIFT